MHVARFLLLIGIFGLGWPWSVVSAADEAPKTGPHTEKRFPPLKVPPGFKATLFACDPLIEYPSVIAAGPRPGAVFVAVDYMTGLGTEIVRRSEVRLVEDTDGDGYSDKATLYAGGFNSIMGLAYDGDTLFVMHAPLLTALRSTKESGIADERKDLLTGLGLTPEENPVRLHCANGVTLGHDGWLYLALGDHGCIVPRPEGDRLVLEGGGILRCHRDGGDLHIFSTGLRNIYDVALDAELNVFVRDNENDGGDYKIRVCHSFFGADHGYPYLYYERPDEALPPIADLGLGSSAGGICYLETQLPKEYRGNLLFCEWGKSLVRYPLRRERSTFAKPEEIEVASSAPDDPYGFKPTDVVVQSDGTLMVSDYADGQRPKRGRGRIYHIAYVGARKKDAPPVDRGPINSLNSESYFERCQAQATIEQADQEGLKSLTEALAAGRIGPAGRLHAIWILTHVQRAEAIEPLIKIAVSDPEPPVRAQAVRAIADLTDPVVANHRLDAGAGDAELAARLAALGKGQDCRVLLEVIVALGRLRWTGTADWLRANLREPDPHLSHAAMQALRRSGNWAAVLKLLDAPENAPLREIALRAADRQYDAELVDGLLAQMGQDQGPGWRDYAAVLAHVYKKPGPWVYWDYRPKPRPANSVAWERTDAIAEAMHTLLLRADPEARMTTLKLMQREKMPISLEALAKWLQVEGDPERVAVLLRALREQPAAAVRPVLQPVILSRKQTSANRLAALEIFEQGLDAEHAAALLVFSEGLEDGLVLAQALRGIGKFPQLAAAPLLARKLNSSQPVVRAAAIEGLGELRAAEGREPLARLLTDHDAIVRRAAARAAGKLEERRAIEPLLKLAGDSDPLVRAASLESLRLFREPRSVPLAVAALFERQTEKVALHVLRELGGPEQTRALLDLAKRNPSLEVLTDTMQILTTWRDRPEATAVQKQDLDRAVAEIHGASGSIVRWQADLQTRFATGVECRVAGGRAESVISLSEPTAVEFLASSSGSLEVSLNGKSIYRRDQPQAFRIDSDRFACTLPKGENRLLVQVGSSEAPPEFHLRFRRKSATQAHETLIQAALARTGDLDRGKQVFQNLEKSLCLKCHRLNEQGERAGPELTGLGSRFSRVYIAEAILDPNRTIAPSFGTVVVRLESGQVLSGVKIAETEAMLALVDDQAQKHTLNKADIEEQRDSPLSTMPEGLEKKLTQDEFVDLVAFLASLKENRSP